MIEIDTYVSILFDIIVAVISTFITIIIGKLSYFKKRDLLFILLFSSFISIIAATLIFCYNKYLYIEDLFPFTKPQFSDPMFYSKYKEYLLPSFGATLFACFDIFINCGDINENGYGVAVFDIKYALLTLPFYLFISTYVNLWFVYALCCLSSNLIIYIIALSVLSIIEVGSLRFFNEYLTFRKLAKKNNTY